MSSLFFPSHQGSLRWKSETLDMDEEELEETREDSDIVREPWTMVDTYINPIKETLLANQFNYYFIQFWSSGTRNYILYM